MNESVVYIIKSQNNGRYCIGSSNNFERRLEENKTGKVKLTKGKGELEVVFLKKYATISEARSMECQIKKMKSKKVIDKIVKEQEISFVGL